MAAGTAASRMTSTNRQAILQLTARLFRYRRMVLLAACLMLLSALADLLVPYLFGLGIDIVRAQRSFFGLGGSRGLNAAALLLVGVLAGRFVANIGQLYFTQAVGQQLVYDLRLELFAHLQRISLRFLDQRGIGAVMSRLQNDVSVINDLFSDGLIGVISDLLTLVGIIVVMTVTNWRLALVAFATLPVLAIGTVLWQRRAVVAYRAVRLVVARFNAHIAETINGIRVIQAFVQEPRQLAKLREINADYLEESLRAARLSSMLFPAVQAMQGVATALIVGVGGWLVLGGQAFTIGELVTFAAYVSRLYDPIQTLGMRFDTLQSASTGAERIFELLRVGPDVEERPDAKELPPIRGEVSYDHVTFGYGRQEVLHDITFAIAPGETVALVGETGAGKTTIAALLPRFYDVWSGAICIDGYDVRDVTLASLRRQIGLVLQDTFLFAGTVLENLTYGNPNVPFDRVVAVCEAIGLDAMIARLPQGYDTVLYEHGGGLSVGQRQLITIARVLLADPRIVILDEATAHVDTETELLVQRALRLLLAGRTALIIAHRLSTVRHASRIIVLHEGRIVESGRHEELLAQNGYYARLYRLQQRQANGVSAEAE
ncbi:MAG: ABC transporter ATP-binding protein [Thermorudis peleae]|nr:ABC transporter ATP-binding protein [Thermorudis peleae]